MSRSCHRATFSIAGLRVAAQDPGEARRSARRGSGCACAASRTSPSGRRRTAPRPRAPRCAAGSGSRSRSAPARRRRGRSRAQQLGVAVAGTTWVETSSARRPSALHDPALDRRRTRRRCRPRPRACPTRDACSNARSQAVQVAVGLEGEAGEAQAEGGRLGMDAVGAADGQRLAVLEGPVDQRVAIVARAAGEDLARPRAAGAPSAVSRTSEEVSP